MITYSVTESPPPLFMASTNPILHNTPVLLISPTHAPSLPFRTQATLQLSLLARIKLQPTNRQQKCFDHT